MPRLGLISDTHDHHVPTRAAIDLFARSQCDQIIHVGDFTSPDTLRLFAHRTSGSHFAWAHGTTHDVYTDLKAASDEIGGVALSTLETPFAEFRVAATNIGVCHSTYERDRERGTTLIRSWLASDRFDFIFYGHLHYFNG